MKFLVTSIDAIGGSDSRRHSEYFPQVVEADWETPWEEIVAMCFKDRFAPRHGKQYLVVAMTDDNAFVVTFKHKMPEFDVTVQAFS